MADAALRAAERAYQHALMTCAPDTEIRDALDALDAVRARCGLMVCGSCGETNPTATRRDSGAVECLDCYRGALRHGHLNVDHDEDVEHCPLCERRAAGRATCARAGHDARWTLTGFCYRCETPLDGDGLSLD